MKLNDSWLRKERIKSASCPRLSRKVSAELTKGAGVSRNEKSGFYGMTLNICLSFLNEVKNLAKDTRFKYSNLCTPTCPYRLAKIGTSLGIRGKLTLRKKEIIVLKCITCLWIMKQKMKRKPSPLVGESVSGADERGRCEQKRENGNKCQQNGKFE